MKSTLNMPVPVVRFEYPDRETNLLKTRTVRVVSMDKNYLKGYEIENLNGEPIPEVVRAAKDQFKSFNLRRIAKNSVVLVAYSDEF